MGTQVALAYPAEQTERLCLPGETVKYNTEITKGAPHISYHQATGAFALASAGKYIVHWTLHVANILGGASTHIHLAVNGKIVATHDIMPQKDGASPLVFADVIQTARDDSELTVLNGGLCLVFNGLVETVANLSIWGLV